jgi:hypothetical protein
MKSMALTPGRRLGGVARQVSSAGLWSGGYFHRAAGPGFAAADLNCRVRIARPPSSARLGAEN